MGSLDDGSGIKPDGDDGLVSMVSYYGKASHFFLVGECCNLPVEG